MDLSFLLLCLLIQLIICGEGCGYMMAKILVSDLYGTLIPSVISEMEYYYSTGTKLRSRDEIWDDNEYYIGLLDRVFLHLGNHLDEYLSHGNYLYLVTASESHDGSGFLFDQIISRFCKCTEKYKDQVLVFLSGVVGNDIEYADLKSVSSISVRDGVTYAEREDGTRAILIGKKADVFDFVESDHDLANDELYAIGDNIKDLPMLFRCIELGGDSSIIYNDLYRVDKTNEKILHDTAYRNSLMAFGIDYRELYDEVSARSYEWYFSELSRLYVELAQGSIDLDAMEKKQNIYEMLHQYNDFSDLFHEWPRVEINNQVLDSLSIYPTFVDYSNKVLIKK